MPNLSGLPPIPEGGVDVEKLVKIADLLNRMNEQEALYGKKGKPVTRTIPGTPEILGTPENRPAPYTLPGIGPSFGVDNLIAPEPRTMPGIGPVMPATQGVPGTPDTLLTTMEGGTPGLNEQKLKADMATNGLIDPESLQDSLNTRGFSKTKFTSGKGKGKTIFYNPYTIKLASPEQVAALPEDQKLNYIELKQDSASDEIGKYIRQRLQASGQSADAAMQLYRTIKNQDPFFKSNSDNILESALGKALTENVGLTAPVESEMKKFDTYSEELSTLKDQLEKTIQADQFPTKERKADIQTAIEEFNKKYGKYKYHNKLNPSNYLERF